MAATTKLDPLPTALAGALLLAMACGGERYVASRSARDISETPPRAEAVEGDDPAHAHAAGAHGREAPAAGSGAPAGPAATLSPDAVDAPAATSVAEARRAAATAAERAGGAAHGHHGATGVYRQVDAGRGPDAAAPPGGPAHPPADGHAGHGAAPSPAPAAHGEHAHGAAERPAPERPYVCPMHPEVRRAEPGACPICAMTLERRQP